MQRAVTLAVYNVNQFEELIQKRSTKFPDVSAVAEIARPPPYHDIWILIIWLLKDESKLHFENW